MKKQPVRKFVFLLPATLIIAVFFLIPALLCVAYSFTDLALTGSNAKQLTFVGLSNYAKMFADTKVLRAARNTVVFTLGSIAGQSILGFSIAYLLREKRVWVRRVVGSIVMIGWVMPEVVAATCMNSFFADRGTLNAGLNLIGIKGISWLFTYPMLTVILANI